MGGFKWKKIQKIQWKDLDPTNKNSEVREGLRQIDEHILQPTWKQLNIAAFGPVAEAYVEYVEKQAEGKYKPLPQWLKLILTENQEYDIDLTLVSYAEGIDTLQEDNAITFGYNIHF